MDIVEPDGHNYHDCYCIYFSSVNKRLFFGVRMGFLILPPFFRCHMYKLQCFCFFRKKILGLGKRER